MLEQLGINAKTASADLVGASTELKNKAIGAIADALIQNVQKIIVKLNTHINKCAKKKLKQHKIIILQLK